MLRRIYANNIGFKAIEFEAGLNIILADRKKESSQKDSRNGLGKTTLLRIINFCLGGDKKNLALPVDKMEEWVFTIEIGLLGEVIAASRHVSEPRNVYIEGNHNKLPYKPEMNANGSFYYKIDDWKKLLGVLFFDIHEEQNDRYHPTFRSLISYFLRLGPEAYNDPFTFFKKQPPWSIQANNAFLLGLNWKYAAEIQSIKNESKAIKTLQSAIKARIVSKGELEAERIKLEEDIEKESLALYNFKVYEHYKEMQTKSNILTKEAHDLTNTNLMLRRKLQTYSESIIIERIPNLPAVETIYEQAEINFPNLVKKTLDEVKNFHHQVLQNRKTFLEVEIKQINNQIHSNDKLIKKITDERAELLQILKEHGGLEEFIQLQAKLSKKTQKLEEIKFKIIEINELAARSKEVKTKKIQMESILSRDYEESRYNWEKAVLGFAQNSQELYVNPGKLLIDISENGYKFKIEIPSKDSDVIGKMNIFCYDLILADIFSGRGKMDFLIHDSTIFDGVDSRQKGLALQYAHKKAISNNFQHICTFNSDMLPLDEFKDDFNISDYIRLSLDDHDPKGSVLGFRFDSSNL